MSSAVRRQPIVESIDSINSNFAGRPGSNGYDPRKQYHIHRKNRAFVWSFQMMVDLLDSILKSYDIPSVLCSSKIEDGIERRYILDGGNRTTAFRKILNGEVRQLTEEENRKIRIFQMNVTVMYNMTEKDERELFRRANKSIKPSDGQLYKMSDTDSQLVILAVQFLEDTAYRHRGLITSTICDTTPTEDGVSRDSAGQPNLANAVAFLSGILNGPYFITKSFDRQYRWVDSLSPIDITRLDASILDILSIFRDADATCSNTQLIDVKSLKKETIAKRLRDSGIQYNKKALKPELIDLLRSHPVALAAASSIVVQGNGPPSKIKKQRLNSGHLLGLMVYDYHMIPDKSTYKAKWVRFLQIHDAKPKYVKDNILTLTGAQNTTPDSLAKKSKRIEIYVNENRIATEEELADVKHPRNENENENENENDGDEITSSSDENDQDEECDNEE
jgi:hypothetical protein